MTDSDGILNPHVFDNFHSIVVDENDFENWSEKDHHL